MSTNIKCPNCETEFALGEAEAEEYKKELQQKKAEELQTLSQKINALKTEINQLTQNITLAKDKLDTIKNSFLLAGEKKQKEILSELDKIAQFF